MAGNIVLVCLFILVGIAGSSLTAEITKKAAVKTSDEKAKRGYVCPNNNGGQWINEPTGHFLYECTGRNSVTSIASEYVQRKRDRRWKMGCGYNKAVKDCAWTSYKNDWDKPLRIECPHYGFIAGVESYFRMRNYDRRFRFKCCNDAKNYETTGCVTTAFINHWKLPLDFQVKRRLGYYLVGMYSEHKEKFQDRRWEFKYCKLKFRRKKY